MEDIAVLEGSWSGDRIRVKIEDNIRWRRIYRDEEPYIKYKGDNIYKRQFDKAARVVTIAEAYQRHKRLTITYIFESHCPKCRRYWQYVDPEYSISGTIEDYREFKEHYDILEPDEKIVRVKGNHFEYVSGLIKSETCPRCEAKEYGREIQTDKEWRYRRNRLDHPFH